MTGSLLVLVSLLAPTWVDVGVALRAADGVALAADAGPDRWVMGLGRLGTAKPTVDQRGQLLVRLDERMAAPAGRVVRIPSNEARATRRFLERWRGNSGPLLAWIDHPAQLARRISQATLTQAVRQGRPLSEEATARLVDQLSEPGIAAEDRRGALGVLAASRDPRVADAIAQRFDQLDSDRLRAKAAGVLARANTPTTQAALLRCARTSRALVQRRCLRLLERAKARGALTPGARQP